MDKWDADTKVMVAVIFGMFFIMVVLVVGITLDFQTTQKMAQQGLCYSGNYRWEKCK